MVRPSLTISGDGDLTHDQWMTRDKLLKIMSPCVSILGILLACATFYFLSHPNHPISKLFIQFFNMPLTLSLGIAIFSLFVSLWINAFRKSKKIKHHLQQANQQLQAESQDRLQAEHSKQKLEVALLQGQKLQAMGTLAGGIAHDFNNILYAIKGYVEMVREDLNDNPQVVSNLDKVLSAANRGQQLISRILAFSRKQAQHFEPIPLNETIEAALALLKPTIPASVFIQFKSHCIATILADKTQIHQILVNLINNAVDAMDGEGKIDIELSQAHPQDVLTSKQIPSSQDYVKIEIRDTGQGMSQSTLERMYEPFFTTKEVGKGTGLGLSIVHSLIEQHQGQIQVETQLGLGTCFTLLFPAQSLQ